MGQVNFAGSTGTVSIYYNPTPAQTNKYQNPTTFGAITGQLKTYMLVNNATDLGLIGATDRRAAHSTRSAGILAPATSTASARIRHLYQRICLRRQWRPGRQPHHQRSDAGIRVLVAGRAVPRPRCRRHRPQPESDRCHHHRDGSKYRRHCRRDQFRRDHQRPCQQRHRERRRAERRHRRGTRRTARVRRHHRAIQHQRRERNQLRHLQTRPADLSGSFKPARALPIPIRRAAALRGVSTPSPAAWSDATAERSRILSPPMP